MTTAPPLTVTPEEVRRLVIAGLALLPNHQQAKYPKGFTGWEEQTFDWPVLKTHLQRGGALGLRQGVDGGEVIDVDADEWQGNPQEFISSFEDLVEDTMPGLLKRLVIQQTRSGGRHYIYRCPDACEGNQKLASRPATDAEKDADPKVREKTLIETRGKGGQIMIAPSIGYVVLHGDLAQIPVITAYERNALIACARAFHQVPAPSTIDRAATKAVFIPGTAQPSEVYNEHGGADEALQLLEHEGYVIVRSHGDALYLRRPGKRDGVSATFGYVAPGVFYVFSSNAAPFDPEHGYSPFAVYTLLAHNGDFKASTKALAERYNLPYYPAGEPLDRDGVLCCPIHKKALHAGKTAGWLHCAQRGTGCDYRAKVPGYTAPAHTAHAPRPSGHSPGLTSSPTDLDDDLVFRGLQEDEAGDALILAAIYRDTLRYDVQAKTWYTFSGHSWQACLTAPYTFLSGGVASVYTGLASRLEARTATLNPDPKGPDAGQRAAFLGQVDALKARTKKLRALQRIQHVLTLASDEAHLGISGDLWDADPWLLAVENGVLDLRTGELRDGTPGDMIRLVAPTRWDGLDAPAPRWERFVGEILSDEPDRVAFLQRLLGYSLNGQTSEHVLAVCVGERGRNGKGLLFAQVQHVLGPYAASVSTDVLIGQDRFRGAGSAQPHLMGLQGRRVAYCSETGAQDRISTAQVKNITGGDPITARHLHQNPITFMPTHTLFLQTNRKPEAPADDDALWERVKVLEFKVRFVEDPRTSDERPRDPALEATLRAEAPGILAWLVRGGLAWLRGGLQTPDSVKLARDRYRREESIDDFIDAACVEEPRLQAEFSLLYLTYQKWCDANGLREKSKIWFGKQLAARYDKDRQVNGRVVYHGIGLETTEFESAPADESGTSSEAFVQMPKKASEGIRTPETPLCAEGSEAFRPDSKSFHVKISHEEKNWKNASNASDASENCAFSAKIPGVPVGNNPPVGAPPPESPDLEASMPHDDHKIELYLRCIADQFPDDPFVGKTMRWLCSLSETPEGRRFLNVAAITCEIGCPGLRNLAKGAGQSPDLAVALMKNAVEGGRNVLLF